MLIISTIFKTIDHFVCAFKLSYDKTFFNFSCGIGLWVTIAVCMPLHRQIEPLKCNLFNISIPYQNLTIRYECVNIFVVIIWKNELQKLS